MMSTSKSAKDHLIIALDTDSQASAIDLFEKTRRFAGTYKIGLELFTAFGPSVVKLFQDAGARIFLDLKLHDIPNTVSAAIKRASEHHVRMLTLHALGGAKMMQSAAQTASQMGEKAPTLLAVSVLTHHDQEDLQNLGFTKSPSEVALDLLTLAHHAGIRGAVCSPLEVSAVRKRFGNEMVIVCPGVRPQSSGKNDQARVATPFDTIRNGADYIVVGRPITQDANPNAAAKQIHEEIENALATF